MATVSALLLNLAVPTRTSLVGLKSNRPAALPYASDKTMVIASPQSVYPDYVASCLLIIVLNNYAFQLTADHAASYNETFCVDRFTLEILNRTLFSPQCDR